jgi:uncharacterized OB-fold protein
MAKSDTYEKPLPIPDQDSEPYWKALKNHSLTLQQCSKCNRLRFYPRAFCTHCFSSEFEWVTTSGKGNIHTFSVIFRPGMASFRKEAPYILGLIDLEEGVRMMSNIIDCAVEEVYIGMPVTVVYDDVTSEVTLPKFRPINTK